MYLIYGSKLIDQAKIFFPKVWL